MSYKDYLVSLTDTPKIYANMANISTFSVLIRTDANKLENIIYNSLKIQAHHEKFWV